MSILLLILLIASLAALFYIVTENTQYALELLDTNTIKVTSYNRFFNKKKTTTEIYKKISNRRIDWISKNGKLLKEDLRAYAFNLRQAKLTWGELNK